MSKLPKNVPLSELDQAIMNYIRSGYSVTYQTKKTAQLIKSKKINYIWIIGCVLFGIVPLVGYFIMYGAEKNKVVTLWVQSDGSVEEQIEGGQQLWADILGTTIIVIAGIGFFLMVMNS